MDLWVRHLRGRDVRFVVFIIANLFCMAGYLVGNMATIQEPAGGWRRIDLEILLKRIETGDLVQREAKWYHPLTEETGREGSSKPR